MIKESNDRCSNIELLRIIAIFFIIAHHFAIHSGFNFAVNTISINRLWIQFIEIGGKIGVNIFVLISGYFLVSTNSIKINKAVKLWLQILFYAVSIFVIFVAIGIKTFEIKEFAKSIAPITFSQWWFASAYFMLYLLSPYVNILLKSFTQKQYISFLMLLAICWCIIPTITGKTLESNSLLWFVFVYSIAGYLRLFGLETKLTGKKIIALSFVCIVITFMSVVVFDVLGIKISFFAENATFFYNMQKLPILVISLLMFFGFTKTKIKYNKFVNLIASTTFGIYLIHDHDYIRVFLWKTLFKNATFAESKILILYSLFVIIVVFIGCTIIELIRIYLIEKNCKALINKMSENIDKIKEKLLSYSFVKK